VSGPASGAAEASADGPASSKAARSPGLPADEGATDDGAASPGGICPGPADAGLHLCSEAFGPDPILNVDVVFALSDDPECSTGYAAYSPENPDGYAPDGKADGNADECPASTG
jgi:hypothetical protein